MRIFLTALVALALAGCDTPSEQSASKGEVMAVQMDNLPAAAPDAFAVGAASRASRDIQAQQAGPSGPVLNEADQQSVDADFAQASMIIRTGNVAVEVDSLELAIAQVTFLAKRLGGYVANSSTETGRRDHRVAQMTLRIPAQQFDAALSGLSPLGKIESQNVGSEDVTEQFVDMTARMSNAKRLEERLLNLLANRTGKLEEVLTVERELARVREEIERYQGRLRYLRTRAAISTLTINLHEPFPITGAPRGSNIIVEAFKRAWRNFVLLLASIISSLGVVIPLVVLLLLFVWLLRRFGLISRFPARRRPSEDPPETRIDPMPPL